MHHFLYFSEVLPAFFPSLYHEYFISIAWYKEHKEHKELKIPYLGELSFSI